MEPNNDNDTPTDEELLLSGDFPDEDDLIRKELEWAENAMEKYKRHHNKMPLRSSIQAAHVHSEDWMSESLDIILNSRD